MKKIRIMVVDDSAVVRRLLTSVIDEDPDLEVVAVAHNGKAALAKLEAAEPDLVTLDIEMPEMNGLEALVEIRKLHRRLPVIMFSTLTERGAAATMDALERGASDYVTKPANVGSVTAAMEAVRAQLIPKVKALCLSRLTVAPPPVRPSPGRADCPPAIEPIKRVDVVAIGSSTGGPHALASVIGSLPAELPVPVVVTQHMPPVFTKYLGQRLDGASAIEVREAEEGDALRPGLVLIAPGDHHMTFRTTPLGTVVALHQGPPVNFCRPSVDVMFDSIAEVYRGYALGVVLTGMGSDGRDGCARLRALGSEIVIQDQASSVVWGMPGAVAAAGLAHQVLPLEAIGPAVIERCARRFATARGAS